jgi:hypothetical protein
LFSLPGVFAADCSLYLAFLLRIILFTWRFLLRIVLFTWRYCCGLFSLPGLEMGLTTGLTGRHGALAPCDES